MPATPHVTKATKYARDVVAGKITACTEARQACQRFLDDLERAKKPSFAYRFDKAKAEKACAFIELLPHTKGEWADRGELIHLEPWQCFIVANVFGWVRRGDGSRRFRTVYLQVPRKNAKSTIAAGIGLYCFAEDGETGAEIYSGATSEKQAWEVFRPAREMVRRSSDFRLQYGVTLMAKSMSILATSARFEPVIGKPGDGASPSCAIVDEFHEHQTPDLFDTMVTGMGARRQPLMLIITTAGSDTAGPCFDLYRNVQQMLAGVVPNETMFGMIFGVDEADDWQAPESLRKANPNFGVSVGADYLLEQQQDAIRYPSRTNAFLTKHLDKWVSARSAWLNLASWKACGNPKLTLESLAGMPVFVGIDLASKSDIAAVAYVGKEILERKIVVDAETHEERTAEICRWKVVVRSYLPEGAIERAGNNRASYMTWRRTGHLIVTEGDELDFGWIRQDVLQAAKKLNVVEVGYDPYRATQLGSELRAVGLDALEVPNIVRNFSPAMREIETAVIAGRFEHADDPLLTWAMSNVVCKEDPNRNIFPRKERDENKIDPAIAIITGVSRGIVYAPVVHQSIYSDRAALGLPPLPA